MIRRPKLLDLFCGAGGAAMGYHRAGFNVVGVDINPQPHYPFEFIQADALEYLDELLCCQDQPDVIHASPPCQAYSTMSDKTKNHPDLYGPTRSLLEQFPVPWVIENVIGAPYRGGIVLCGSMFGLRVRRHRNFESSVTLLRWPCDHKTQGTALGVYGWGGGGKSTRPSGGGGTKAARGDWADIMGMPWATPDEIRLAVPPAYTEFIGYQLRDALNERADLVVKSSGIGIVGVGFDERLAGQPQEAELGFGDGECVGHASEYECRLGDVKS